MAVARFAAVITDEDHLGQQVVDVGLRSRAAPVVVDPGILVPALATHDVVKHLRSLGGNHHVAPAARRPHPDAEPGVPGLGGHIARRLDDDMSFRNDVVFQQLSIGVLKLPTWRQTKK